MGVFGKKQEQNGANDVENGDKDEPGQTNGTSTLSQMRSLKSFEEPLPLKDHHVVVELDELPPKNIGEEVRGAKDLLRFSEELNSNPKTNSLVLLDVEATSAAQILREALAAFLKSESIPTDACCEARKGLLLGSIDFSRVEFDVEDDSSVETLKSDLTWRRYIQGNGYMVAFSKAKGLKERLTCLIRLKTAENAGGVSASLTQLFCIVLAPAGETKPTKSDEQTAKYMAAMLQDDEFYKSALIAQSEEEVRNAVNKYVTRALMNEETLFVEGEKGGDGGFEDMARTGKLFGGLIGDVKRKYRWSAYKSDWTDGWTDRKSVLKYISTTAWLYFAVIMPIIAFGAVNDENTNKQIGVSETVLSQAIAGGLSAVLAGQPLAITMTTGPVTVFISVLFAWSEGLGIPFLPFYAWTGIWGAVILTLIVMFDLITYVKYVGQFTEEIFAMLVACIFISNYIKPLIDVARDDTTDIFLLSFLLAGGMYVTSRSLSFFERSYLLNGTTRTLLADFGMPMSVLIWSGIRQIFTNVDVAMLEVPEENGIVTTNGRSWFVPLGDLPIGYIFLAIVPALFLCMLFYVDQNVAVLLTNKNENKLTKGYGYFLDMQVIAISMFINSILGLPWCNAAVPHSHLHAKILAETEEYEIHGRSFERTIMAREVRITNFLTHVLIFVSMFLLFIVGYIPKSVVWGFFLYIGVATLDGNQMWERLILVFTQPTKYPPNHYVRRVPIRRIFLYTAIQFALLILLWFVNENFYLPPGGVFNFGLLFPFVIMSFIPIRKLLLPRIFEPKELHALELEKEEIGF